MTNGEKLKEVFPDIQIFNVTENEQREKFIHIRLGGVCQAIELEWWNVEYQEPTTKNDLALIHTEGLDEEIRCTMCTNSMKSDRGCDGSCVVNKDMYKGVMDAIEKRIQPTTKNNLGDEYILRSELMAILSDYYDTTVEYRSMLKEIAALPPVTP